MQSYRYSFNPMNIHVVFCFSSYIQGSEVAVDTEQSFIIHVMYLTTALFNKNECTEFWGKGPVVYTSSMHGNFKYTAQTQYAETHTNL